MIKLRQQAGLRDKRLQPGRKSRLVCRIPHHDRAVLPASGKCGRQVFLDGHRPLQRVVEGLVNHAETTGAERALQFKLGQPRTRRKGIRMGDQGNRRAGRQGSHGQRQ